MHPEQLKETLRTVFEGYGKIIDIVAKRNLKAKGQAFIVYDNADSAARAVDEVQGFQLFEKPMVLHLARSRSDAFVKLTGDDEDFEAHHRHRLAEKGKASQLHSRHTWPA